MDKYIQIGDDVTEKDVKEIEGATSCFVVHSICATIPGRKKMAQRLKAAGVSPDIVRRLGWATSTPKEENVPTVSTPDPSNDTKSESVKPVSPRGRKSRKRSE